MNLNEFKFLEELRKIDEEIKSACLELREPSRAYPADLPSDQVEEIKMQSNKRRWRLEESIYESSKKLSYLLSLVEADPFEDLIREFYPLVREALKEKTGPCLSFATRPCPPPPKYVYTKPKEVKPFFNKRVELTEKFIKNDIKGSELQELENTLDEELKIANLESNFIAVIAILSLKGHISTRRNKEAVPFD